MGLCNWMLCNANVMETVTLIKGVSCLCSESDFGAILIEMVSLNSLSLEVIFAFVFFQLSRLFM